MDASVPVPDDLIRAMSNEAFTSGQFQANSLFGYFKSRSTLGYPAGDSAFGVTAELHPKAMERFAAMVAEQIGNFQGRLPTGQEDGRPAVGLEKVLFVDYYLADQLSEEQNKTLAKLFVHDYLVLGGEVVSPVFDPTLPQHRQDASNIVAQTAAHFDLTDDLAGIVREVAGEINEGRYDNGLDILYLLEKQNDLERFGIELKGLWNVETIVRAGLRNIEETIAEYEKRKMVPEKAGLPLIYFKDTIQVYLSAVDTVCKKDNTDREELFKAVYPELVQKNDFAHAYAAFLAIRIFGGDERKVLSRLKTFRQRVDNITWTPEERKLFREEFQDTIDRLKPKEKPGDGNN